MADPYQLPSAEDLAYLDSLPDERELLKQKLALGRSLFATPGAQGQQVGRTFVASSPLEHLSVALQRAMGGQQMRDAQQGYQDTLTRERGIAKPKSLLDAMNVRAKQAEESTWNDPATAAALRQAMSSFMPGLQIPENAPTQVLRNLAPIVERFGATQTETSNRKAQLGETERHNRMVEGLTRGAQGQDAWMAVPDQSGGVVMFNKKTGEYRPLGPQGRGAGPAGAGSGLKPQQFESDVQALGKDMEPIAKVQPDLATLKAAAERGNMAGFGPGAGLVPSMLTSTEGVANRQAAGRIMAGIIQMISGQAASEKEVERLLEANGLGRRATDAQIKEGVAKLAAQYQTLTQQRSAKYHPQVVETYGQRGGYTGQPASAPGAAPAGPKRVKVDAEGNVIP